MSSDKSIKVVSALSGFVVMALMALVFSVPGLLLGAIFGLFLALWLHDWLQKNKPENRRRIRRMMRNEGVG
jgi:uncharacterized protein YneF (UPF0154 family)